MFVFMVILLITLKTRAPAESYKKPPPPLKKDQAAPPPAVAVTGLKAVRKDAFR